MRRVLHIVIVLTVLANATKKSKKKIHKRKKIQIEYEYLPQDYKDPATVICTKPSPPSKGTFLMIFKAQVWLRYTSAFNRLKFLSFYLSICQLSQVFQI